jgi:hypothetical protein
MGKVFNDNEGALAAFDEVAMFPKWSNAKKSGRETKERL